MIGKINADKTIDIFLEHKELNSIHPFKQIKGILIQKYSNLKKAGIIGEINLIKNLLES